MFMHYWDKSHCQCESWCLYCGNSTRCVNCIASVGLDVSTVARPTLVWRTIAECQLFLKIKDSPLFTGDPNTTLSGLMDFSKYCKYKLNCDNIVWLSAPNWRFLTFLIYLYPYPGSIGRIIGVGLGWVILNLKSNSSFYGERKRPKLYS